MAIRNQYFCEDQPINRYSMKRSIFLVANKKSEDQCANLIYSIRESGCTLPINLIHFGGEEIKSDYILNEVNFMRETDFSDEARSFIDRMQKVINFCPRGFLYRFLALFSDYDEILYSDNDIVALCNWESLFEYMGDNDLVHADLEYTTKGKYNYYKPEAVKEIFGEKALESAITAGHILIKIDQKLVLDIDKGLEWFKSNDDIPVRHDQALLHIASLLGNWKIRNLCKTDNWLSSWAGHFKNDLDLIQKIQAGQPISHLHYSGGTPSGTAPIDDLLYSNLDKKSRTKILVSAGLKDLTGMYTLSSYRKKGKNRMNLILKDLKGKSE